MQIVTGPLRLPERDFKALYRQLGPSLGLWRGAEIAALREVGYEPPVLDLGAGDGLITAYILPRVSIALDPDSPALERAAARAIYDQFVPLPIEEASLPAGSLGAVISNSVLEHIPRIDDALSATARSLRPGGRLAFTAPTEAFSRWLALPGQAYAARRNRHFQHLNLWPVEEWARRLARVGLQVECVRPYMRRGWVWFWDALELLQMVSIRREDRRVRLFGRAWRSLPPGWIDALARRSARLDLSAPQPGGGRMIVARKVADV